MVSNFLAGAHSGHLEGLRFKSAFAPKCGAKKFGRILGNPFYKTRCDGQIGPGSQISVGLDQNFFQVCDLWFEQAFFSFHPLLVSTITLSSSKLFTMVNFNWVMHKTESLFDFTWLCGSVDHVHEDSTTSPLNMNARFVKNVWSDLEYETSMEDSFDEGHSDDDDDDDDDTDRTDNTDEGTDVESTRDSILSCQEPEERGSNIPVLRQLPSFGSALASNSLQSGIHTNSSGLSSYPTRSSSMESSTSRRFAIKPIWGRIDEESPLQLKSHVNVKMNHTTPTDSFIFLRQ